MTALPIADRVAVRRAVAELLRHERAGIAGVLGATALAAAAGAVAPWLLGRLVTGLQIDAAATRAGLGGTVALILTAAIAQILFIGVARGGAARVGERLIRRLREQFVDRVLALPLSTVERAGTGDLMTRSSEDMTAVGSGLRDALPTAVVGAGQALVVIGAVFWLHPLLGLCVVVGLPPLVVVARWYLRRAREGYLAEGAASSRVAEQLALTAAGARTVEALSLQPRRLAVAETAIAGSLAARLYTLGLRCVLIRGATFAFVVPTAVMLLVGGLLHAEGLVSLGAVVAATLYSWQLIEPVDRVLTQIEDLQTATASFARIVGVGSIVDTAGGLEAAGPRGAPLRVEAVRHAYVAGRDVLHGVDLDVVAGERLAIVGPSGAGKSTLGRLVAGIDAPRSGSVTVGGVAVVELTQKERRRRVLMVTQEHHVFIGTLRDNLTLATECVTDAELSAALDAVDARWAHALPDGLDTVLGAAGTALDAGQEQQVALARVVLADPDTVVLDEATALLDPATARHTERSLSAVLAGRTVIAIAHRLQTARDADRVAVMEHGRITECGTHEELLAAAGAYATLWRSWHGDG